MWGKHPFWILDNCVIEVRAIGIRERLDCARHQASEKKIPDVLSWICEFLTMIRL